MRIAGVSMKKTIHQALALGLGIGVTGKEKIEQLVTDVQKQLGKSRKESKTIVDDIISKGEKVRKQLDKDISAAVRSTVDTLYPVSRKEFDELKAQVKRTKKKSTRKKSAKKSAKKSTKKRARKSTRKSAKKKSSAS
jgi:polyhydroxyalkanoate synthesis regulator phasin